MGNRTNLALVTNSCEGESQPVRSGSKSERLLRFRSVQERVPYSHSQIYLLMKNGGFPRPVSLGGRAVAWRERDIDEWIESRKEA